MVYYMRKEDFMCTGKSRQCIRSRGMAAMLALCLAAVLGLGNIAGAATPALTDVSVTDAVEDELILDTAVRSSRIDVETNEGIVTLDGVVDNILAKDRATKIAKGVKGVRAVINQIEAVPPVLLSDNELSGDVKDALLTDPATESYEIDVSVKENAVTLTGRVDSWQEKQLAEKVVKGVSGVTAVENRIRIDYETTRADLEIKEEIEQALRWDTLVDHFLIDVAVEDGSVSLSGTVGSVSEKTEAVFDAWVTGVTSVDASDLEVKTWARDADLREDKYVVKSEEALEEAIRDALLYDPRVSFFNITVEVTDSEATLRGRVDNLKAKHAAEQVAKDTVGVGFVDNRIKVRPALHLSDSEIKDDVEDSLSRNPYVEKYEIDSMVTNGIVYLSGYVDTYFEKAQAENVVSKVPGVIEVENNITVDEVLPPTYDPYLDDYNYGYYEYGPGGYPAKTDNQILEDIREELFWSPFVDADSIKVSVEDGVATLKGDVASWSEYHSAVENAYEGGSIWVRNKLEIE